MSDKNQHIDKAFTDHAWSEMRQLLDAEMPSVEESRKRRFAWWWFLTAAMLLCCGGALAWYFSMEKPMPAPVSASPETPIATVVPAGEVPAIRPSVAPSDLKVGAPDETATGSGRPPVLRPLGRREAAIPSDLKVGAPDEIAANSTQLTDRQSNTISSEPLKNASPTPSDVTQSGILWNEARLAAPASLAHVATPLLPSETTPAKNALSLITPSKPSGIQLSLQAGAQHALPGSGDGLAMDITGNKRLGDSKFSLETGVGYAFLRQPIGIAVDNSAPVQNGGVSDPQLDNFFVGYASNSDKSLLSRNSAEHSSDYYSARQDLGLHYLEVPAILTFHAAPRLQLLGGAQFSMLLLSAPDYTKGAVLDFDDAYFGASENGNYDQLASQNSVPLSKFDAAAVAGARLGISKKMSLELRYQFGITDVIQGNDLGDYNRMLRMSLRFRLGN